MKDSKLVEAIVAEIGEMPLGLFLYFPPLLLMSPLFLFFWAASMTERISPVACAKLCEVAHEDEKTSLLAVVCARNNRPFAFDLWKLKNKLRAAALQREDEQAIAVLKAEYNK